MFTSLNIARHPLLSLENESYIDCNFPNLMILAVKDKEDKEGWLELPLHPKYAKENTAILLELAMLAVEKVDVVGVHYPKNTPKNYSQVVAAVIGFFPNINKVPTEELDWHQLKAFGSKKDWDDGYWLLRGYEPSNDKDGAYRKAAEKLKQQADQLNKEMKEQGIIAKRAEFKVYFKRMDT